MAELTAQVSRLDLSARAVDLTAALLNATLSSNSLLQGAWEIGQWLGREQLNKYELLDCMTKAKGLVFPNKNGQNFFEDITRGLETVAVGPLFLRQSGSLGRLLAGDPNLCWMVSTVACLFQHHRDDRVVTEIVTALLTESLRSRGQDQALATRDQFIYNPEHARLRVVVRKIVSSVWFNVVNVGCDTISVPQEIISVCAKGHYLDPADFGIVISTICTHCPSKAILRTSHLLRDVILWLLLHYDGLIVVNVGGQLVYQTNLGNRHRELEIRVTKACSEDDDCAGVGKESYQILRNISGNFEEFLSGHSFSQFTDSNPQPGVRQKLYEIPRPYPTDSLMWNKGLQLLVKCSAQSIMHWLLSVPLMGQVGFSSPGFTAIPSKQATGEQMTVSLVLKRIPAMVNLQWGSSPPSQVFHSPAQADRLAEKTVWDTEPPIDRLLEYFPVLADLAKKVSADCRCPVCSRILYQDLSNRLRQGCLKRAVVEEALLLLGHGVADGLGVEDASSVADVTPIVEGMTRLLSELVWERIVLWDTWFMVASCVCLGCPFVNPVLETHPAYGGTSVAAIQYGNLASQAPWLDLTRELTVPGCFALITSRGRLGVVTTDDEHAQFRSVEENFAIIETENTEDTTAFCSRYSKEASLIDHNSHLDHDDSTVESDVILYQVDDRFYRLLLRIKTKTHWRILDPSDAFNATIRMLALARCQHLPGALEMTPMMAKIYTFDEVVGRWPETVQSRVSTARDDAAKDGGTFHLTNVLNSHLKKNIALSLSVCSVAVANCEELACLTCTINNARKAERTPLRKGESGNPANRYIVNISGALARPTVKMQHYFIEGANMPDDNDRKDRLDVRIA